MSTEHWWNDADRGQLKHMQKSPFQCHFISHEMAWDWIW